jgi:UDP-galactose transporter B1
LVNHVKAHQVNYIKFINIYIVLIVTILFNVPIIGAVLQKLLNIPKSAATQTKNKANYSFKDLIKVTLTTFSVLLFNFGGKKKETSSSSLTSQDSISITVYLGYILLIFSLLCDGLLSLKEHIIFNNIKSDPMLEGHDKVISMELFMINSFISLIFCIGSVIYGLLFGDLKTNLMLYLSSGSLIRDVFMYGIFTSLGQVVIFIFLEKFGPLTLSMITSIRKVITIAVSIILFGKTILPHQFVSLIFAGVVIVWEMVDKKDKGKKDKKV